MIFIGVNGQKALPKFLSKTKPLKDTFGQISFFGGVSLNDVNYYGKNVNMSLSPSQLGFSKVEKLILTDGELVIKTLEYDDDTNSEIRIELDASNMIGQKVVINAEVEIASEVYEIESDTIQMISKK